MVKKARARVVEIDGMDQWNDLLSSTILSTQRYRTASSMSSHPSSFLATIRASNWIGGSRSALLSANRCAVADGELSGVLVTEDEPGCCDKG